MTIALRVCGGCGSPVPQTAPFCARCGTATPAAAAGAVPVAPPAQGPVFGPGVVFASAASRVGSWAIEIVVASVLVGLTTAVSLSLLRSSSGTGTAGLAALVGTSFAPSLVGLAWGVASWVWEARTGNRIGSQLLSVRSVAVPTMSPPGLGRALGSRLILGLIGTAFFGVVALLGTAMSASPIVVLVLANAGTLLVAGSCAWDNGRFRQGWHERVSGTSMVTVASLVAFRSVGGPVQMPGAPTGLVQTPGPQPGPASSFATAGAALGAPGPTAPAPPWAAAPAFPASLPTAPPAPTVAPVPVLPVEAPRVAASLAAPSPAVGGLIADVPGFAPAQLPVPVAPVPVPAAAQPSPSVPRSNGSGPVDEDDELEHTQISAKQLRGVLRLAFDTGEQVDVTGLGLVGRAPAAAPGDDVAHTVEIDDPSRSVSKTHLAFWQDGSGFWVSDRGSTNGTRVMTSGVLVAEVGPAPVLVPVGAVVEFGDRSFAVGTV